MILNLLLVSLLSFVYVPVLNASIAQVQVPLELNGVDIDIVNKTDTQMSVKIGGSEQEYLPSEAVKINASANGSPVELTITSIPGGIRINIKEKLDDQLAA